MDVSRNASKSYLDSVLLWNSPESKPSKDLVPVPTLVVIVTSLLPTSQVFVLPPANRNSPTGDLKRHFHVMSTAPRLQSAEPPEADDSL